MKYFYKIAEVNADGTIKTLFHGVNGSRKITRNKWLKADLKMVRDGKGTEYLSGWHILPSEEVAIKYLKKFKNRRELLKIIPCKARRIRKKTHSKDNVFLAEYIKV